MNYTNTPCDELNIDICKTKTLAIARADLHASNGRSAEIYSTDGLTVANISVDDATGVQAGAIVINSGANQWVVASWRKPG